MNVDLFGNVVADTIVADKGKYTRKINSPIYTPWGGVAPDLSSLVDTTATMRLIDRIEKSHVSNDEKRFLIEAAHRHSVLHFERIAEYYTHASPEMQELMEENALVVIDFNKSIELGYTRLDKRLRELFKDEIAKLKEKDHEK